jgi:hypothetical protein
MPLQVLHLPGCGGIIRLLLKLQLRLGPIHEWWHLHLTN